MAVKATIEMQPLVVGSDEAEALVGAARTAVRAFRDAKGILSKLGGRDSLLRELERAMGDLAERVGVRI